MEFSTKENVFVFHFLWFGGFILYWFAMQFYCFGECGQSSEPGNTQYTHTGRG